MPIIKDNRVCKKVKFKLHSTSSINGSLDAFNKQHNRIHTDCQPFSFPKSHLLTSLLLLLSFCSTSVGASAVDDLYRNRAKRSAYSNDDLTRPDTICNQGGTHECVCNRSLGNLDDRLQICDRLLEEKQLTVISLIMRNINLDVKLHTNEPYQQYFRRRIANIVSQFCEHQANECTGAILSLNRNNVIILRVNYLERQRTEIQLVVAKESMPKKLTEATLIDSKKVKDILLGQLAPLSRVLGGVQIEKLRLINIDRRKVTAQNRGLFKLLIIIVISMSICYTIACFKVWRDNREKNRIKKSNAALAENNKRNYGSCTDKLLATCEAPNGKIKTKSITSRVSTNSKDRRTSSGDRRSTTHSSKRSNNNNEDLTSLTIDINRDISQPETSPASGATDSRSFQRMFACDLSQLPAESSDLMDDQDPDAVFTEDSEAYDTQMFPKQNYVENAEVHSTSAENTPIANKRPPIVPIVIASGSQASIDNEPGDNKLDFSVDRPEYMHQDSSDSVGIDKYFQPLKSPLLSAINELPFDRPLSRRGSRDSTPEKGHEEFDDDALSVDSLQPLGDQTESPQNRQLAPPEITFEQSSSDESEDEPAELYHKLKEESIVNANLEGTSEKKPVTKLEDEPNKTERVECSESDEELLNENRMMERHAYERLEESPLPSPSIYTNNNSVTNNLKTKTSEDAVNNASEHVPNDYEEEDLR